MSLLGEMHYKPQAIDSFFSLPREDGIAYAAQEAWIQNATIKVVGVQLFRGSELKGRVFRTTLFSAHHLMKSVIRKVGGKVLLVLSPH